MTLLKFSTKVKLKAASFPEMASITDLKITLFFTSTQRKKLKEQEALTSNSTVNLFTGSQSYLRIVEDVATRIIKQKIVKLNITHHPKNTSNCMKNSDQPNIGHVHFLVIQPKTALPNINHPVTEEHLVIKTSHMLNLLTIPEFNQDKTNHHHQTNGAVLTTIILPIDQTKILKTPMLLILTFKTVLKKEVLCMIKTLQMLRINLTL